MIRILLVLCALLLISAVFFLNKDEAVNTERYRTELKGELICLKAQDTAGSKSGKCDYGIKTDKNEVYAIDFNLLSQNMPELSPGDKFSASGNVTPIEMISTDYWQKYGIKGIFSVTDSVKKH